jgi:peptide/nickel transport system substrate-binding protein
MARIVGRRHRSCTIAGTDQGAQGMKTRWVGAILSLIGLVCAGGAADADQVVLRVVPHADLKILDPHTNTATITLMHGQMIYDTLFAWDEKLQPRPEMVDTYTVSPDKLAYTFTLRPGLKFHDGQQVTSRDAVASLKRWMVRDTLGQTLAKYLTAIEASDDNVFVIRLNRPFAFVETALGSTTAVIMRAQDAATDPYTAIATTIGSGPFRFVAAEWNPGARVVYEKNPDYVPRPEPASGVAGGKVVKVDRVEFVVLPDPFTKSSALQRAEVDLIDQLPRDQIPILEKTAGIVLAPTAQIEATAIIRPNSLFPPFSSEKARQALALIVNQPDYLGAAFGDQHWWRPCFSFFVCGSPNETEAGAEPYRRQDLPRAKALFRKAGYEGEKITLINTHEIVGIGALGDVTAAALKQIGLNVDIADSDWGSMVARRARKDPPDKGGWNIFHTTVGGAGMYSPMTNFTIDSGCDGKNWFGWPCDQETQALRQAYVDAPDVEMRRAALIALQQHLWQAVPVVPVGQYVQPYAARSNLSGILKSHIIVFWNIAKS